ncbi:G-PROTEIN-RECEP-F1-2 domain-containing protein [Aphelenchoides bicaudatus]|nr:G-PROTEIN-RECEP-F1-2 domain-containing protein [Aphelenchoides bicaudatus]
MDENGLEEFSYELLPTEFPPECSQNSSTFKTVEFLHMHTVINWPNFTQCLPHCGLCQPSATDQAYLLYNFFVIGLLLPLISICGLFGNGFSAYVYSRPAMRSSTNLYLCCLGFSDNSVLLTALFLFFLDSIKRYSLRLTILFNTFSPYVYPAGMIAQTCSVYFTLVAAIDCFTHVCLPDRFRQLFDSPKTIRAFICSVVVFSILYNVPHCFESVVVECWHLRFNSASVETCPAPFRFHPTYTDIYYKYLYSIFLAVGPLVALICINTCIIFFSMVLKLSDADPSDNVALILVVLLFISCNTIALLINIFEENLASVLSWKINYIIDFSNLLVAFNSSFNFIIYYRFSRLFRRNFRSCVCGRCSLAHSNSILVKESPALLNGLEMGNGTNDHQKCATLQYKTESNDSLNILRASANKEVLI